GGADWVSIQGAPQEILDIISRTSRTDVRASRDEQVRPAIVTFVPSSGGGGNPTLAIETALQIKRAKQTRSRRGFVFGLRFAGQSYLRLPRHRASIPCRRNRP